MAQKLTRATNVVWEKLDDGALLVDAGTGARWSLNATAAALWTWCDGRSTLNQLALRLSQSSHRTLNEARVEVRAFCAAFAAHNLLASAGAAASSCSHQKMFFSALNSPA